MGSTSDGTLTLLNTMCKLPLQAEAETRPFHNAYQALQQGQDYSDTEWGRCDPLEFIYGGVVKGVLRFAGHLHPNWGWNRLTSIDLLGDDIPVLDTYQMPITLFAPLATAFPDLSLELETIVSAEETMGGVVKPENIPTLLDSLNKRLQSTKKCPSDADNFYDAMTELAKALTYASEHQLSFTEMIE